MFKTINTKVVVELRIEVRIRIEEKERNFTLQKKSQRREIEMKGIILFPFHECWVRQGLVRIFVASASGSAPFKLIFAEVLLSCNHSHFVHLCLSLDPNFVPLCFYFVTTLPFFIKNFREINQFNH